MAQPNRPVVYYYRDLKNAQNKLEKRMQALIRKKESVEQCERQDTLEINGVPEQPEENLGGIVAQFFIVISCDAMEEDIVSVKRIRNKQPRPIVAKLRNRELRDQILCTVVRFNKDNASEKLNSNHLGFAGIKIPILVSGHPSRLNKVHRQITRSFVHRHSQDGAAGSQAQAASMPPPPPPLPPLPAAESTSPVLPVIKSLRELCQLAMTHEDDEAEMTE